MAAQRVRFGAATVLNGQEVRILRPCSNTSTTSEISLFKSLGRNRSSEVISLFLEDWEVGRVALSCHLSMDFFPRNAGCVWEELRVSGFSSLLVFGVPGKEQEVF